MVVIAANDGYLPGCVTFALRGGRGSLPALLRAALPPSAASQAGPALASMLIYVLMAGVLAVRPEGLFPGRTG
jgi:branched-chain amino acid transport system permease protein